MNETQRPDPALAAEEDRRIRELQRTMDLALFYIEIAPIPLEKALRLFPDKEEVFELIYQPRFRRVLTRRFGRH